MTGPAQNWLSQLSRAARRTLKYLLQGFNGTIWRVWCIEGQAVFITTRANDRTNLAGVFHPIEWGSDPIQGRNLRWKTRFTAGACGTLYFYAKFS